MTTATVPAWEMLRQHGNASSVVRGEGDGVQHLRKHQKCEYGRAGGGDASSQYHHSRANHEPSGQTHRWQPSTLAEEPINLYRNGNGPQHANGGFAVAQLVAVQREEDVQTDVRYDVKKQSGKKPLHFALFQNWPNGFVYFMRVVRFFGVWQ